MKKTIAALAVIMALAACNNNGKNNNDHQQHTAANKDTSTKINEMQSLMDGMMAQMHSVSTTGNNDLDFAAMMTEHHRGAVAMAKLELEKGTDSSLKAFAGKVVTDQEKEIAWMADFIGKHPATPSPDAKVFHEALMGSMTAMMDNKTTLYNNTDKDFAAQMIPHHQSAVDMAKVYLQYGNNAMLKPLAASIVKAQESEINWLKEWLAK